MSREKVIIMSCLLGLTICNLIRKTESTTKSFKNLKHYEDDQYFYENEIIFNKRGHSVCRRDRSWNNPNLPLWSKLKYAGDPNLPDTSQSVVRSYPMFFFEFNENHQIIDKASRKILGDIAVEDPKYIDFYDQLENVKTVLKKVKDNEIQNCYNFDSYPNLEFHEPLITLMNAYGLSGMQRIRIHGFFNAAMNDAMVITWYYKFLYEIPRPNQLDDKLETMLCTPYHPSYPSGHIVLGSTVIELLSSIFPEERDQLDELLKLCKRARLYSGVHYDVDNIYGELLGRKIGKYIFGIMQNQKDENEKNIDNFKNPETRPLLKVEKRNNNRILKCNSLIDRRSINYNKKWRI